MTPLGPKLFALLWPPAALAAGLSEPAPRRAAAELFTISLGGADLPLLTAGFAVLGVLLSRPLAPKGPAPLGTAKQILVSVIIALIALFWVIETRPGLLFSFVVAIGLGFSGHAVIELAGTEVLAFFKRLFGALSKGGPGG